MKKKCEKIWVKQQTENVKRRLDEKNRKKSRGRNDMGKKRRKRATSKEEREKNEQRSKRLT